MGNREINKAALDSLHAVQQAIRVCGCSPHAFFARATEVGAAPAGFDVEWAVKAYMGVNEYHCTRDVIPPHVLDFASLANAQPSIRNYFRTQGRQRTA